MVNPETDKTKRDPCDPQQKLLLEEYRQLCEDWRLRDKYVLEKFVGSSVVFGLIGIVFGQVSDWRIQLVALSLGALFAFIASVSVAKDILYRDGTGRLVGQLATALRIKGAVDSVIELTQPNSKSFAEEYLEDGKFEYEGCHRRVKLKPKYSSLNPQFPNRDWIKWVPWFVTCPASLVARILLVKQPTFNWVLAFYQIIFLVFLVFAIWVAFFSDHSPSNGSQTQNSVVNGTSINVENNGMGSPTQSVTINE